MLTWYPLVRSSNLKIRTSYLQRRITPPSLPDYNPCETDISFYVCIVNTNRNQKHNLMETAAKTTITVEATVNAPVEKVWKYWNEPAHITKWCAASDDWHAPHAENDLRKDGNFKTTMAAKDGSFSFDFGGTYTNVEQHKKIEYVMSDGRKVSVTFSADGNKTHVSETFGPEETNSLEMQRSGWQAILDNFKKHTETNQ